MNSTKRPASPTLFQVAFTNGDTWTGTEQELRTQHPKWIPYATVLQPEANRSSMNQQQSNRPRAKRYPPGQQAATHRAGHYAGIHPDDTLYWTTDLDAEEPDEPPYSRTHTSIRRYDLPALPPVQGKTRYKFQPEIVPDIRPRRSAQHAKNTSEPQTTTSTPAVRVRRQFHTHWLVLVGVGAITALLLWFGGTQLGAWWQETQWNWTYTSTFRTYSVDAVVGHNRDNTSHPSHFIVQNDKRRIVIVEFPADDPGKVIVYYGPLLLGKRAGQNAHHH